MPTCTEGPVRAPVAPAAVHMPTFESQIPVGFEAVVIFLCLDCADGRLVMGGFVQDLMSLYLWTQLRA